MVEKNQKGLERAMQRIEDRDMMLESGKETKKHHRESERCGQDTLVAQWRARRFLAIILLYLYNTRGGGRMMRKGALKKGLIKNGN